MLFERTGILERFQSCLRLGMIYGRGILMVDAARWLARRRLLCVWRVPTLLQLLSTADFLRAAAAAIDKPGIHGIYHVGDEQPVTAQEFLDAACRVWGCPRPRRVPFWMIYAAAGACELGATIARTASPLTRDFVTLGRVPHWGDTRRAREELVPELLYPTLESGLSTLQSFRARMKIRDGNPYVYVSRSPRASAQSRAGASRCPSSCGSMDSRRSKPWRINLMPIGHGAFYLYLHGDVRRASKTKVGDRVDVGGRVRLGVSQRPDAPDARLVPRAAREERARRRKAWDALIPSRKKKSSAISRG